MPIYEYVCQKCEKVFETLRPMSQSDAPIPCAVCGGKHTKRKISVFFAESGGKAVSGMSEPSCDSCGGGELLALRALIFCWGARRGPGCNVGRRCLSPSFWRLLCNTRNLVVQA